MPVVEGGWKRAAWGRRRLCRYPAQRNHTGCRPTERRTGNQRNAAAWPEASFPAGVRRQWLRCESRLHGRQHHRLYADIQQHGLEKTKTADKQRVVTAVKNLNEGTDLETHVDVDEVLRYFAVNMALVNLDSYVSSLQHNYYLYENGMWQISILPWNFNLAFGAFQSCSASDVVNFPIDTLVSDVSLENRPLIGKFLLERLQTKKKQKKKETSGTHRARHAFVIVLPAVKRFCCVSTISSSSVRIVSFPSAVIFPITS